MEVRPLDDSELINHARHGRADAYETLVERYSEIAFRTAYLITSSRSDAEEVTQDAFVKAHKALDRFRLESPFRPWLLRIVSNEARNRRRSVGRRREVNLAGLEAVLLGDPDLSPEGSLMAAEERRSLLRAVKALDVEGREVVACRYFLDLNTRETAEVLGCAEGTVKSRLSRAVERLRASLGAGNG